MQHDGRTLFEDAIDVPLWLEADRETPLALRADRDREVARRIAADNDLARVRAWWTALRPGPALGIRLDHGRRLTGAILTLAGLATGSAFASAALHYDGSAPVNVVSTFAVLVGVQSVMLLLTLLMLLPGVPGVAAVQRAILSLDPAVFAAALYRRFAALPHALDRLFAWHAGRSAASAFAKWQLLAWSQSAAVAFNVGLLGTAFALLAFTDLAFGWSTTLAIPAERLLALTTAIATPWRALLPEAVPTQALIEATRFFRLEDAASQARTPETFTGWWPFLLATIVVYGLLPRVLLRALVGARLSAAARRLLLEDPGVTALLDRMSVPSLHLSSSAPEGASGAEPAPVAPLERAVGGQASVIVWAGALPADRAAAAAERLFGRAPSTAPVAAGGAARLDEDRAAIERIADAAPRRVAIFTRAWEPPLLDFLDFAAALRRSLGAAASIVVCLVPEPGGDVTSTELTTWRTTLARLNDAHVYVEGAP